LKALADTNRYDAVVVVVAVVLAGRLLPQGLKITHLPKKII
jgi:hypothetical protein